MPNYTIKLQGSADEKTVTNATTSPVFVVKYQGKSYVSILLQEVDKLPQAAQNYYRDKYAEAAEKNYSCINHADTRFTDAL